MNIEFDFGSMSGSFVIKEPKCQGTCGLYFLINSGRIVYVGQSVSIESRVSQHFKEGVKVFDSAVVVPYGKEFLSLVEGALIRFIRPELNGKQPSAADPSRMQATVNSTSLSDAEIVGCFQRQEDLGPALERSICSRQPEITFTLPGDPVPKLKPIGQNDPDGTFDQWWKVYPNKVKKKQARKAWYKNDLNLIVDKLVADVENRKSNDRQWAEGYVPHPTTYINGERWEDDIQKSTPQQASMKLPRDVNKLMAFGTKMGYPARSGEDEQPYRDRLLLIMTRGQ